MRQPEGKEVAGSEGLVCKLNKSLYGLKQAPCVWNEMIDSYLKANGYAQATADTCIYIQRYAQGKVIITLYVNNLLLTCLLELLEETKSLLHQ